jgi:hypothetical protein
MCGCTTKCRFIKLEKQLDKSMIDRAYFLQKVEELQAILDNQATAYDYEQAFDEKWSKISQEVFQQSLGDTSKDRNKKKR